MPFHPRMKWCAIPRAELTVAAKLEDRVQSGPLKEGEAQSLVCFLMTNVMAMAWWRRAQESSILGKQILHEQGEGWRARSQHLLKSEGVGRAKPRTA